MAKLNMQHVREFVNTALEEDAMESPLARALLAALSALMDAEVSEVTGAGLGERTPARKAQRNGYRARRFDTGVGTLMLQVPKLRQGRSYLPSFLTARQRSDDALRMALASCYHQGVSTRKAEAIAQALGVDGVSKDQVSAIVAGLDPQIKAFQKRDLPACPYVFLDARYEHVREDHRVQKMAVMTALGVREDGGREVLGYAVRRVENAAWWGDFLDDLKERGLRGVQLVVSDAHEGLKKAIAQQLPEARWQRCKVHFLRNLGSRIPKQRRAALLSLAKTIFEQGSIDDARQQRAEVADVYRKANQHDAAAFLESADEVLTHMLFPKEHRTKLHSTNMVERLNRELKRRTRVVSIFPNRASLSRLVGALLLEEHEEWIVARRYISERSMARLKSTRQQLDELVPGASRLLDQGPPPPEHDLEAAK